MGHVLSSPGMIAVAVTVCVVQVLSLVLLWLNMHLFRQQAQKYQSLLRTLGNETAWENSGRMVVLAYFLVTLVVTAVITYLLIFQPHLL